MAPTTRRRYKRRTWRSRFSFRTYTAVCVTGAALAAAVLHSRPAATAPRLRRLAPADAHDFYSAAAEAEVEARKKAVGRFRGSPWSRDDDFHNKEAKFIRAYAKSHKVTIAGLIDVLDRGMRESWPTPPNATPDQKILPCRPRLNY